MKAKLIKESVQGAGFSYGGGIGGGSDSNSTYSYNIRGLNHTLEPKPSTPGNIEPLHIGLTIKGKKFNDNKKQYFGKLINIYRNSDNSIKYYVILDEDSSTTIKLNPTTVSVINNLPPMGGASDIWNFQNKGNLYNKKKTNESKLVSETLEELNEELLGTTNNDIEIYKNPKTLKKLEGWERAISDEDGNLYLAEESIFIHTKLLKYLQDNNIIKTNARWHSSLGVYVNCIAWQRKNKTNDFYLSESYDDTFMKSEKIFNDIVDLKDLVEITNPQFKFHLEKIEANMF
jgi:hypothetical protein